MKETITNRYFRLVESVCNDFYVDQIEIGYKDAESLKASFQEGNFNMLLSLGFFIINKKKKYLMRITKTHSRGWIPGLGLRI